MPTRSVPTPVRRPARTARRIIQIASLGLAGLLAGLIAGCASSSAAVETSYAHDNTWHPRTSRTLPQNLDATQAPNLKHSPSPRRLLFDDVRTQPAVHVHNPDRS